jgi:hypothetical protein
MRGCCSALNTLVYTIVLLLSFTLPRSDASPTCSPTQLKNALRFGELVWSRRAEREPRYQHCPVLTARYNCSRFDTSAAEYELTWRSKVGNICDLPTLDGLRRSLANGGVQLLLLGDSHMQQIYQSMLCLLQDDASVIIYVDGFRTESQKVATTVPCHGIPYSEYARFYLDDPVGGVTRTCTLGHSAEKGSCLMVGSSRICQAYLRPLLSSKAIQAAQSSLSNLNLSLRAFKTVAVNTYLEAGPVGSWLQKNKWNGHLVVTPKFDFDRQRGRSGKLTAWSYVPIENRSSKAAPLDTFCRNALKVWGHESNEHSNASTKRSCSTFDWSSLAALRNRDSKASIYPTTIPSPINASQRVVCQPNQDFATSNQGKCADYKGLRPLLTADMRVCSQVPCTKESHFCLPGPTDDFAMFLLGFSASYS